jgi:transcriptional regulator with XRE-family HTH domain
MANTTHQSLGDVLRDARVAADLSLRQLATKLGITPSYISDIENNRRVPSEDVLRQFAETFDLKFDELMALAGRVGNDAERYLRQHPTAGVLFRRISDQHLSEDELKKLVEHVEGHGGKKSK